MNIKTFTIHSVRNVFAFFIALGLGYVAYTVNPTTVAPTKVEAGTAENISGWAWSDTIGWISFNSTSEATPYLGQSYGVGVSVANKSTGGIGNFSGNAWSRGTTLDGGIGWISFDRTRTGNPPAGQSDPGLTKTGSPLAYVDWQEGKVYGWARALAGCEVTAGTPVTSCASSSAGAAAGGWDGWIKLGGDGLSWGGSACTGVSNNANTNRCNYGIKITGNKFTGYAWGGADVDASGNSTATGVSVVGWINFAPTIGGISVGVQVAAPPCTTADVPAGSWGTCSPIVQCSAAGTSDVAGIQVGVCSSGGTVTRACTVSQTCAAPSGAKPKFWQF